MMIFRQLFDKESSTYTYLLGDADTKKAVIIDPVFEQAERDERLIRELGLDLFYILETHVHADHVTGSGALRDRFGAKAVVSADGGAECPDVRVKNGDTVWFGSYAIEVRATPGHTDGCVTYVIRDGEEIMAFTGDALFVRGCGRTDFQQGSPRTLYRSVHEKIYSLPDHTKIYPGHDYNGYTASTVGEEKRLNPRLNEQISEEQFVAIMDALHLPSPRMIDVAVPANLQGGRQPASA